MGAHPGRTGGRTPLKGVYLVALTGYALPEDLQRALEVGFDQHLAKPPELDRLEQILAGVPSAGAAPATGRESRIQ